MTSYTAPVMGFTVWMALKSLKAKVLAERVGFEPTIPVKVYTLSKRAPSATRPSLRTKTGWKRTTTRPYSRELPRATHSGFRLTAPASLTPSKRLNFSHSAISPAQDGTSQRAEQELRACDFFIISEDTQVLRFIFNIDGPRSADSAMVPLKYPLL